VLRGGQHHGCQESDGSHGAGHCEAGTGGRRIKKCGAHSAHVPGRRTRDDAQLPWWSVWECCGLRSSAGAVRQTVYMWHGVQQQGWHPPDRVVLAALHASHVELQLNHNAILVTHRAACPAGRSMLHDTHAVRCNNARIERCSVGN
jgi:hypothetical protein